MKKMKVLGALVFIMSLWFIWKPVETQAAVYSWEEGTEGVCWYEINYTENTWTAISIPDVTEEDTVIIRAIPDDECRAWLANLDEDYEMYNLHIEVLDDENIVIGKENGNFSARITATRGNITYNGNPTIVEVDWATVTINGNVGFLSIGREGENLGALNGNVVVNGNVQWISWVRKNQNIEKEYNYFSGNCNILGTVNSGRIIQLYYDEAMDKFGFFESGELEACDANTFVITNGVLTSDVSIIEREPNFEYDIIYIYGVGQWVKEYREKGTGQYVGRDDCTKEDIPEGAVVNIYNTDEEMVIDINLSYLSILEGQVIVNGDVTSVSVDPFFSSSECNAVFNGDIENLKVFYKNNPNLNVSIFGSVDGGEYYDAYVLDGYFECQNVQLISDGIWNEKVLIKKTLDDNSISYEVVPEVTVADAIGDTTIGEEVTVDDITIVKSVKASLEQTKQEIIESISKQNDFVEVLEEIQETLQNIETKVFEAEPVCAVDISVDTFYRDRNSGSIYTADSAYGMTNIPELPQGNSLEFAVKIPENNYKATSKYEVVRQHENGDGSKFLDRLKATQNGDMLTFSSDKFSTFVIVEVEEIESAPTPTPAPDPTATPEPTVAPVVTPSVEPTQVPVVTPAPEADITVAQGEDGNWYSTVNGVLDPNYTGLAQLGDAWWMVVNGKIDFTYTSPVFFDDNWWFVRDGLVEFDYNGLVFVNDDWWYVVNGRIDFGFNGLAFVNDAWWYVSSGRIDFSYTGLIYFSDNWWFVQNGCVNFGYTGLAFINDDWWYVVNGKIDFAYCGLFDYDNQKWYVQGGKIDFSYNNVYYFNDIWWYIETGKVNFGYNGLAYTQFNDKWWYVINGVISFDYTGAAYANDKYWYVERGEIDFQRNGKVTIDGVEKNVAWGQILM